MDDPEAALRELVGDAAPAERRRVVHVGCGDGALLLGVAAAFRRAIGLTADEETARAAGAEARRRGMDRVVFSPADRHLRVPRNQDLVVLDALGPPVDGLPLKNVVTRAARAVAPGGTVVLDLRVARRTAADRLRRRPRPVDEVRKTVEGRGLRVVRTRSLGPGRVRVVAARPAAEVPKVLEGRDGRLFLDHDSNRVVDQHAGRLPFDDETLARWSSLLRARHEACAARGARFAQVIAPNAHAVYEELLPADVPRGARRPVLQLLGHLRAEGHPALVLYPLDELRAARDGLPYPPVDTHWSGFGGWIAYRAALAALGPEAGLRVLGEDEVAFTRDERVGDLGRKLLPPRAGTFADARVLEPRARVVDDNRVRNNGRVIRFAAEGPDVPDRRLLCFGDSFGYPLLRFLAESAARVTFAHSSTIDAALLEAEAPDVVLCVLNERFLPVVPDDAGGRTLAELYELKRGRHRVMTPQEAVAYSRKLGWP